MPQRAGNTTYILDISQEIYAVEWALPSFMCFCRPHQLALTIWNGLNSRYWALYLKAKVSNFFTGLSTSRRYGSSVLYLAYVGKENALE